VTLLVLHGLSGNEPEHWQTWLATRVASDGVEVRYPDFPDPDAPSVRGWMAALDAAIADVAAQDLLVAAHSLGCHLWMHLALTRYAAQEYRPRAARVVLVAPPGAAEVAADIPTFTPATVRAEALLAACPDTAVVLGEDDPWLADPAPVLQSGLAVRWVADGSHLNVAAGYGPWPAMLAWTRGGPAPGAAYGLR